jgi:4'-phosphopantetheinyl transferase
MIKTADHDKSIAVWLMSLQKERSQLPHYLQHIKSEEMALARTIENDEMRLNFYIIRSILRQICSQYFDIEVNKIVFERSLNGKLSLVTSLTSITPITPITSDSDAVFFDFSISHSNDVVALAFSRVGAVGVDVQYHDIDFSPEELAQRFFSDDEYDQIISLNENLRKKLFLRSWTRKEALIKAIGSTFYDGLDVWNVDLMKKYKSMFYNDPRRHCSWYITNINFHNESYSGAVAVKSAVKRTVCIQKWKRGNYAIQRGNH